MEHLANTERFNKVIKFLIKIATGNFSPHIERTNKTDELEALTELVNIVAEEVRDSFAHQGFVNSDISYMEMVHMVFFLDKKSLIVYMNGDVSRLLDYRQNEIFKKSFRNILHKDSLHKWDMQLRNLLMKKNWKRT